MLAVLGFVTILLVLALIMSKKVSTLVALIFVPAITGFIAAFINAPNVIIQAAHPPTCGSTASACKNSIQNRIPFPAAPH